MRASSFSAGICIFLTSICFVAGAQEGPGRSRERSKEPGKEPGKELERKRPSDVSPQSVEEIKARVAREAKEGKATETKSRDAVIPGGIRSGEAQSRESSTQGKSEAAAIPEGSHGKGPSTATGRPTASPKTLVDLVRQKARNAFSRNRTAADKMAAEDAEMAKNLGDENSAARDGFLIKGELIERAVRDGKEFEPGTFLKETAERLTEEKGKMKEEELNALNALSCPTKCGNTITRMVCRMTGRLRIALAGAKLLDPIVISTAVAALAAIPASQVKGGSVTLDIGGGKTLVVKDLDKPLEDGSEGSATDQGKDQPG